MIDDLDHLLSRFDVLPISRPVATTAATIIATLRQAGRPLDDLRLFDLSDVVAVLENGTSTR
ncbi:hypothetical protein [Halorubrum ezzemoulense]|uniref:hypothetical protein n=1 Tax=Halorubrum ezzemoulense TaxID=337243 RepID=UPI00232CB9CE|nr:hypothetical protein [Halorubrum ezzemoulense]MDB2239550.1 hypothetical protein [Halorubrum ezzemoulense]